MGMAALFAAGFAAGLHKDSVLAHVSMQSSSTAQVLMPSVLSALLKQPLWQSTGFTKTAAAQLHSIYLHKNADMQLQDLALKCLLVMRDDMDTTGIQQLSRVAHGLHVM